MLQTSKAFLLLGTFLLTATPCAFGQTHPLPPLTHHVRTVTRTVQAPLLQRMSSNETLQLDIVLPLSNPAGLDAFLKALYDPSSPAYHHYLTPAQFTAQFGPTQAQYDAVVKFANDNGLTVIGGTRDGMDVQVKGPVSVIENAFNISMGVHQHPTENRTFYAPDREPTLALPFQIWHISGLSNYSIPHPLLKKRSDYAQAHAMNSADVVTHAMTGSGANGSFLGSDMRAAYYGSGSLTGAGQTLGLLEYQGTNLSDVSLYYANTGQTLSTPITLLSVDGRSTACRGSCDDTEPTIDITQALGMAPGLDNLIVYIGYTDTAIFSAMTTRTPLPTTIGCSWGWNPADPGTLDIYFKKMEAQGQTFFVASGDNSTWTQSNYEWPGDDPYVVTVGGTDLVTTKAAGTWGSETAWVDSGGGVSTDNISIPSWQQIPGIINSNNNGSTVLRNGPDVAANADFSFYVCANGKCTANEYGGTSFAAPMWAGYIALANEQAANDHGTAVGFINPTIYAQNSDPTQENGLTQYETDFHDVAMGTSGSYTAVSGYDLVTGWGSPTPALIDALVSQPYSVSASPGSLTVAPGSTATTTLSVSGCCSESSLSANLPAGFSVSFNPPSITGSGTSVMTIAAGSSVQADTYPITVTAGTASSTVNVVVTAGAATPSFSLSVDPASATVKRHNSVSATVAFSGNVNSRLALSASGMPSGVTVKFSPSSTSASNGAFTMTVSAANGAAVGNYTIVVSGRSGGTTASTTFQLTVVN